VTLRKPADVGMLQWIAKDLNLKNLGGVLVLLIGFYVATTSRITVIEANTPSLKADVDRNARELDELRHNSVSKEDLAMTIRNFEAQQAATQASLNRIEGYLMDQKPR
jgi:hypothetical protein